ncbi:MAG: hypothetical protein ABI361_07715 [Nitrososphaera sp.]|jgi:hypothetical protein
MSDRKCIICSRPLPSPQASNPDAVPEGYCVYHAQAYSGLLSHYRTWAEAYGKLPWKEYLSRIVEQNETGSWIREIAEAELKKAQK